MFDRGNPQSTPDLATYRQVVVLDIVWRAPIDKPPEDDWAAVVAQALNEEGALWDATSGPTERLVPQELDAPEPSDG